jgi:hypothetical protein
MITPLEGITATPNGRRKLPASVVTTPLFAGAAPTPATTSAAVCVDASPAAPHSSAAAHVAGAAHFTQALALHAALPTGSAGGAAAPLAPR